jgi:YdjC-like protein
MTRGQEEGRACFADALRQPQEGTMDDVRLFSTLSRAESMHAGALIINADDWGRDRENTQRTMDCVLRGSVSSVSAMVFMQDSERAAAIAREHEIDAGLHLNLTSPFSVVDVSSHLVERQQQVARYLARHRLAGVFFHPGLAASFEYVVQAQIEEFSRLYGAVPRRIDGHHHMHLCANVILAKLLPLGIIVRRNFSFQPGEKSWINRQYRSMVDRLLARRHRLTDFFFSLPPLESESRMERIFSLARTFAVEVETHPVNAAEYRFLAEGEIFRRTRGRPVARGFAWTQA